MRPGGERRGNNADRRRRRVWLLATFDQDLGPNKARCHLSLGSSCKGEVDIRTLTVDRIEPGGTYRQDNIRPACRPCQNIQGALITQARRADWRRYWEEAQELGIEWDGSM